PAGHVDRRTPRAPEAVQVVAVLLLGLTRPSSAVPRQPVSAAPTDGPRDVSPLTICPILDDLVLVVGADPVDAPAPPPRLPHPQPVAGLAVGAAANVVLATRDNASHETPDSVVADPRTTGLVLPARQRSRPRLRPDNPPRLRLPAVDDRADHLAAEQDRPLAHRSRRHGSRSFLGCPLSRGTHIRGMMPPGTHQHAHQTPPRMWPTGRSSGRWAVVGLGMLIGLPSRSARPCPGAARSCAAARARSRLVPRAARPAPEPAARSALAGPGRQAAGPPPAGSVCPPLLSPRARAPAGSPQEHPRSCSSRHRRFRS